MRVLQRAPEGVFAAINMLLYIGLASILKQGSVKVATLPQAAQQKIGEELLLHVEKVRRLSPELQRGLHSLDHGEGHELHINDAILFCDA